MTSISQLRLTPSNQKFQKKSKCAAQFFSKTEENQIYKAKSIFFFIVKRKYDTFNLKKFLHKSDYLNKYLSLIFENLFQPVTEGGEGLKRCSPVCFSVPLSDILHSNFIISYLFSLKCCKKKSSTMKSLKKCWKIYQGFLGNV